MIILEKIKFSVREGIKKFTGTNETKAIYGNALWLFSDKILRQGVNFILTAWIARYLGVEQFGTWSYAIAFVGLFSFFSTLGLYNLLQRDLIMNPKKKEELIGSAFILKFTGGAVTLLISYITIVILKPEEALLHDLVLIIGIGYLVQSLDVIDFFFQSQLKAKWVMLARSFSFFFFSIIKISFVLFGYSLSYFVVAMLGELVLSGVLLAMFYIKYFGSLFNWKIDYHLSKSLFIQSLPILFSEIAIIIYMRIDQVMVGEMRGESALGIFSAAVRLSEIWYFIPGVICSSFFPSIIKSHSADPLLYGRKLQRLYDILIWMSIGIGIFISVFSHYFVSMIYGSAFDEASSILTIHIWSSVFVFIGFASNQQLVIESNTDISFYRTVLGLLTNVFCNLLFIPIWGGIGAAYATLVAQAFSSWIGSLFFAKSRSIFWMNLNSVNPSRLFAYIKERKVT